MRKTWGRMRRGMVGLALGAMPLATIATCDDGALFVSGGGGCFDDDCYVGGGSVYGPPVYVDPYYTDVIVEDYYYDPGFGYYCDPFIDYGCY